LHMPTAVGFVLGVLVIFGLVLHISSGHVARHSCAFLVQELGSGRVCRVGLAQACLCHLCTQHDTTSTSDCYADRQSAAVWGASVRGGCGCITVRLATMNANTSAYLCSMLASFFGNCSSNRPVRVSLVCGCCANTHLFYLHASLYRA
jgi:hypothetical protein